MSAPDFPVSCLATYRKVKMGWFQHMSVPGFLCQVFLLIAGTRGSGFKYVCNLAFPVSCLSPYRRVKKEVVLTHVRTCLSRDS